jgi:hypothetical protein
MPAVEKSRHKATAYEEIARAAAAARTICNPFRTAKRAGNQSTGAERIAARQ